VKRIVGILMVAHCMVAKMLVMAAPAFAVNEGSGRGNPETAPGSGIGDEPPGSKMCRMAHTSLFIAMYYAPHAERDEVTKTLFVLVA
jgi:hypothetical protein